MNKNKLNTEETKDTEKKIKICLIKYNKICFSKLIDFINNSVFSVNSVLKKNFDTDYTDYTD